MMIHALLAFNLSFGMGLKWENTISAHEGVYLLRLSSGLLGLEGGYCYHKIGYHGDLRGYRTDLWASGGPWLSGGPVGFYPYIGFGRYLIEPLESDSLEGSPEGLSGSAGLSAEWDIPKTNTAVFGSADMTKLFGDTRPFDNLIWSISGGLMFRAINLP